MKNLSPSDVAIAIDAYGEYRVKFFLPTAAVFGALALLASTPDFATYDHGGNWAIFGERGSPGFNIGLVVDDRSYLEISGTATIEGEDSFDYTRVPTELSLSDRLYVAATARKIFARIAQ